MSEFVLSRNERGQLIHTGPAVIRQSVKAAAGKPGRLQMLCPYGHLIDSCETGTVTASQWLADQSFGTPRVVECGGRLPDDTEQRFLNAELTAQRREEATRRCAEDQVYAGPFDTWRLVEHVTRLMHLGQVVFDYRDRVLASPEVDEDGERLAYSHRRGMVYATPARCVREIGQ